LVINTKKEKNMAKPVENKDEKAPNEKQPLELTPNMMILLSNAVIIAVVIISMIIMYASLDSSFSKKIEKLAPEGEQMEEEGDEEKEEGVLLDLGDFILNLADVGTKSYLKVSVAIELSKTEAEIAASNAVAKPSGHGEAAPDVGATIIAEMERYKPAIRDAVISVLSNKTSDELKSPTGKEISKEEILEMVNNIFEGQREVMRVSFGQFIIQ
jgi:flagellar FliL protein